MASTPTSRTRIYIISGLVIVLVFGALLLGAYLGGNGTISMPNVDNIVPGTLTVRYSDVEKYVGQQVSVKGYVIIPNDANTVCFGGWSTCKLWLDNDPSEKGLGLHEVSIRVGSTSNTITTDGILRGSNGGKIKLVENDAFNWYSVKVTGTVLSCKSGSCQIEVHEIKSN